MFHVEIIKDGDVTKVQKEILVDGQMYVDETPREGSENLVTSGGVNKAIGDTKESVDEDVQDLQEQIDDIAEKAGSGYIPKGEATVATLNALSGQENGWLYTMTDAGTLTDGSLAVVAGDTVAWDAANSVWYKAMDYAPRQYGTNEVHNLSTAITAFRTGDVIPVDGPSGTAKMSKDDLLKETAENAVDSGVAVSQSYLNEKVIQEKNDEINVTIPAGMSASTWFGTPFVIEIGDIVEVSVPNNSVVTQVRVWFKGTGGGEWHYLTNGNSYKWTSTKKFNKNEYLIQIGVVDCVQSEGVVVGGSFDIGIFNAGQTTTIENRLEEVEKKVVNVLHTSDIADNLTTSDASKVLSAKQGKVLKEAVDNIYTVIPTSTENALFPNGGYYQGTAESITDSGSSSFPLTDFIPITDDTLSIEYKLKLANGAYVIIFFDENKDPLTSISVSAPGGLSWRTGTINLKDATYASAKFFRASSYKDDGYFITITSKFSSSSASGYQSNIKICALGDSITEGHMNGYVGWPDYLYEMLGNADGSLKFAHSGAIMRTMADECTQANMADIDVVIVMGGTNQNTHYSLGTIDDAPTPDDIKANTSYSVGDYVLGGTREHYGWHPAYVYNYSMIYKCTSAGNTGAITNTDIENMTMTIGNSSVVGGATFEAMGYPTWYADLKHVMKKVFDCNPNVRLMFAVPIKMANAIGQTTWARSEKFQAIRDFCGKYSLQYIDLEKQFPMTPYNVDTSNYAWGVMADVTHPNGRGYKLIAEIVAQYI